VRGLKAVFGLMAAAAALAMAPAAMAASISGTVSSAVDHGPIAGIDVCADPSPYHFEGSCAETDAAGAYTIGSLPAASYSVRFSADRHNLNYVNQFYGGKDSYPGDLVTVGDAEAWTGIDAELLEGGAIEGSVTHGAGLPVAGFLVCAFAFTATGEAGRCSRSGSDGAYAIRGLPSEDYKVEFASEDEFNYLNQYWQGSGDYFDWDPVAVTAGGTVTGIDAELEPGVEIAGTVREAGTGQPLAGIRVTLLDGATEEPRGRFAFSDTSGRYAFRGRPGGTYVVAFSHPFPGEVGNDDWFSSGFYDGATSFAAAARLTVAPPQVLAGIDGEVLDERPPRETVQVILNPVQPPIVSPGQPRRCRKGFRKRRVKGRVRCVKVNKSKGKRHRKGARHRARPARG
jgi:hypothetical protein